MKAVVALHTRRVLTDQQLLTAAKFQSAPAKFKLPPTWHRFLHEIVSEGASLDSTEAARGWRKGAAKAVLSTLLFGLQELGFSEVSAPAFEEVSAREQLAYLCGDDVSEISEAQIRFGMTPLEARLFLIFRAELGRTLSRNALLSRLYLHRADTPVDRMIDVYVCKLRRKLGGPSLGYRIVTVRGCGFQMVGLAAQKLS